jgi:ribonucleoside-diphosphate reductase alpha chain
MSTTPWTSPVSARIWDTKYRYRLNGEIRDATIEDTWRRIAAALASVETHDRAGWEARFYGVLQDFRFLPGGRIQAGAGTAHQVTLFNCFVMGTIDDSLDGIFDALKEGALTMQQGGGVGYDFSTLRPQGEMAHRVGMVASGPVSFMRIWDSMCGTILSTGARRGAMMATLRCDHPDIERFIRAKSDPAQLRHFNLSVLVSDAFMQAVRSDADWPLVFPLHPREAGTTAEVVERRWSGGWVAQPCRVYRRVRARALWQDLLRATYDYAEPGVIFIDRVNRLNNLWYREHISATNPCGEIPLPPYGACDLGSINLTRFVRAPFTPQAQLDHAGLQATAAIATRMLDNVTDVSRFPLVRQAQAAHGARRIGLGITGLADALIMLGLRYGDTASLECAGAIMRDLCHTAYRTSIDLAREKGAFPQFERNSYLQGEFVRALPEDLQHGILDHGIRNSHLTAIAPTGTISLLAGNVSSGLEPVFSLEYQRRMRESDGGMRDDVLQDYAYARFRTLFGAADLPPAFVTVADLAPAAHLDMQAALQPYVDNAISKTINVPVDYDVAEFRSLYDYAYDHGLKGCTVFRPNAVTGEVLSDASARPPAVHCCSVDREAD